MRRKIYERLLQWKNNDAPDTAILIDGARRVGKSYVAEQFAKAEYKSYVLIDFNIAPREVKAIFDEYLDDLDEFFKKISSYYAVTLYVGETLFIFDEVQEFPRARAAIKYLVADGRYHYLETGSLVSIQENVSNIVIPSEEDHIKMYPLDFEEFLWATGREGLVDVISSHLHGKESMGAAHRKAKDAFREYLVVGGMPQAVVKWVETADLKKVDAAKRRIIALYRADIRKHAGKYAMKAEAIFDEIPGQLQKHDKKFRLSALGEEARVREYGDAFLWLKDAMTVNVAYNSTEPSAGLALSAEQSTMKCYLADTGLLVSLAFGANPKAVEDAHRRIMFDSLSFNEGMLTENAVAQMLAAQGLDLFFYSRYDKVNAAKRMEIDFLVANAEMRRKKNVTAVEVKSEKDYSTASLDKFRAKFAANVGESIILHPGDLSIANGMLRLPLYMTPWIDWRFIEARGLS